MKIIFAIFTLLILQGCTGWYAVKAGVAERGAVIADEELEVAEYGVCTAVTMGAWQRRYGSNQIKKEGWVKLCNKEPVLP